jgi:hypothetical protein
MINSIDDLGLNEILKDFDKLEVHEIESRIDSALQEKLGVGLENLRNSLCESVKNRAEELALDLPNIAPYNDYGKLLEDNDSMATFLRDEASKLENWLLNSIQEYNKNENLIKFLFVNKAVDDGQVLEGIVFVNKSGVIRHAFAQVDV